MTKQIDDNLFELQILSHWKIRPVFNEWVLTPYKEDPECTDSGELPIMVNGQEEYKVDNIIRERTKCSGPELLIRWKGYGPEFDTWEPLKNLMNAVYKVEEYYKHQGTTNHPKRKMIIRWINENKNVHNKPK